MTTKKRSKTKEEESAQKRQKLQQSPVDQLVTQLKDDVTKACKVVPTALKTLGDQANDESTSLKLFPSLTDLFSRAYQIQDDWKADGEDAGQFQYKQWLKRQFQQLCSIINDVLASTDKDTVQVYCWVCALELSRTRQIDVVDEQLLQAALFATCKNNKIHAKVYHLLAARINSHPDLRFTMLRCMTSVAQAAYKTSVKTAKNKQGIVKKQIRVLFGLLREVQGDLEDMIDTQKNDLSACTPWCTIPEQGHASKSNKKRESHVASSSNNVPQGAGVQQQGYKWLRIEHNKQAFSDAWIAFMKLPIQRAMVAKILTDFNVYVLPHITKPLLLTEFLTRALDQNDDVSALLALQSMLTLMLNHGLEYPDFYPRVYRLLTYQAVSGSYRKQFLKLLDVFLATGLLPAYYAAAFAKRLSRLALFAPSPAAMACCAIVHNILTRHPSSQLIILHAPAAPLSSAPVVEEYKEHEAHPSASRAINSQLWELESMRKHACPAVALLATSILDKDYKQASERVDINVGDMVEESYASLILDQVQKKKLRRVPVSEIGWSEGGVFGGDAWGLWQGVGGEK